MPAELLTDPLGIACEFTDGRQKRWLSDGPVIRRWSPAC